MTNTLIIRAKSAKFKKDTDYFSKMDPFLRITVGAETQRTETALNQGKTPSWKAILSYKLTPQQIAQIENLTISVEAFDEDSESSAEFLGRATLKFSQARIGPGEINTLNIADGKNRPQGTVDLEIELKVASQGGEKPSPQGKVQRHAVGTVVVRPSNGKIDVGVIDQQELYLVFIHGDVAYQTGLSEGTGRKPVFRDIISFQFFEGEDMIVRCFDNDPDKNEMIGEGPISLVALSKRGNLHQLNVALMVGTKKVGEIAVEVEFFNDVFENPVKVYPTISVKKGDFICKKIKYSNPDKFKKNLKIRTENKEVVFVKTETLTILPNEFGEIRLKIFAPQRTNEDKCRVDIVVDDTHIVEESLLFKVRGV